LEAGPLEPDATAHATAGDGTRVYFETFTPTSDVARQPAAERTHPVLLVMGLGVSGRLWGPAVRRLLAAGYDVITFDNRGSGHSEAPWRPWSTRTMAADAVAVMDEIGVERAHVWGGSLGGMVAQEVALNHPGRVSTLILCSTSGGWPRADLLPRRGLADLLEGALRTLRSGDDPQDQVSSFLCMVESERFAAECRPGDETWETVVAALDDAAPAHGYALQLLAGFRHSTWSRLHQMKTPVQLHHGTADRIMPVANARELARYIRGARLEVYDGAGHALFGSTEDLAKRILAFLSTCEERERQRTRPSRVRPTA
jgi:pimeloyl-ACP methyl ester carboxylesterase